MHLTPLASRLVAAPTTRLLQELLPHRSLPSLERGGVSCQAEGRCLLVKAGVDKACLVRLFGAVLERRPFDRPFRHCRCRDDGVRRVVRVVVSGPVDGDAVPVPALSNQPVREASLARTSSLLLEPCAAEGAHGDIEPPARGSTDVVVHRLPRGIHLPPVGAHVHGRLLVNGAHAVRRPLLPYAASRHEHTVLLLRVHYAEPDRTGDRIDAVHTSGSAAHCPRHGREEAAVHELGAREQEDSVDRHGREVDARSGEKGVVRAVAPSEVRLATVREVEVGVSVGCGG